MITGGLIAPVVDPSTGVVNRPVAFDVTGSQTDPDHFRQRQKRPPMGQQALGLSLTFHQMDDGLAVALDEDMVASGVGGQPDAIGGGHHFRHCGIEVRVIQLPAVLYGKPAVALDPSCPTPDLEVLTETGI